MERETFALWGVFLNIGVCICIGLSDKCVIACVWVMRTPPPSAAQWHVKDVNHVHDLRVYVTTYLGQGLHALCTTLA